MPLYCNTSFWPQWGTVVSCKGRIEQTKKKHYFKVNKPFQKNREFVPKYSTVNSNSFFGWNQIEDSGEIKQKQ